MNLEQLAKEVIEKGKAATPLPKSVDSLGPMLVSAAPIATPLAQAFLELKEAAEVVRDARGRRCSVCDGVAPSWDGHDRNPPCELAAFDALAATIERIERPL